MWAQKTSLYLKKPCDLILCLISSNNLLCLQGQIQAP